MFGKKSFIAAFILMPVLALADLASDWANAPMGIVITNCVYDTYGVKVQFETDLEPPYIAAVYESWEDGLGRNYPIAETTCTRKDAFVQGDFTDVTTFVEVMSQSRIGPHHRLLTKDETLYFRRSLESRPVRIRPSSADYSCADVNRAQSHVMSQLKGLELVSDHTWVGIIYGNGKRLDFEIGMRKPSEEDSSMMTDLHSPTFSINNPSSEDQGSGWRIVYNDSTGECLAMRALSARTNASQTVYLPRLFNGLSSYNGYRLTKDQNGVVICVPYTNNVTRIGSYE